MRRFLLTVVLLTGCFLLTATSGSLKYFDLVSLILHGAFCIFCNAFTIALVRPPTVSNVILLPYESLHD